MATKRHRPESCCRFLQCGYQAPPTSSNDAPRADDDRDEELPVEPRLFGPQAAVITADTTAGRTAAFIVGTNPRYYAECNLTANGSDDWIHEYDATAAPGGGQNNWCGPGGPPSGAL